MVSDDDMDLTDGDDDRASTYEEGGWMTAVSQEHHGVEQDDLLSTTADEENENVDMEEDDKEDGEHDRVTEYVSTYLGPSLLLPAAQSSTDTIIDCQYRTH